jgi:hypothetical protein
MADELDREMHELFAAGARERPTPELRERLLSVPRAQESSRFRPRFALIAAGVALAAGAVLAVRAASVDAPDVQIARETPRASGGAAMATPPGVVSEAPTAVAPAPAPLKARLPKKPENTRAAPAASAKAPRALGAELALLNEARSHLSAGDAARALQVLSRYAEAPNGSLHAEATLLRMEALVAAGRGGEAAALSREFIARYPESPLVDRARSFSRR